MSLADFFEEEEKGQDEATPSLAEVFKKAMEAMGGELRVAMPAEVVTYDKKKQSVDVKPAFKRKYKDGKAEDSPVIYSVPVAFPRAGDAFISMPIKTGDSVLIIFMDRSLEKWSSSGGSVDPEDTRAHHLSDAVAYPGLYPFSDPVTINNDDDIIIYNGKGSNRTEMRIKPNGHLQIINQQHELIKILDDWIRLDIVGAHQGLIAVQRRLRTFLER